MTAIRPVTAAGGVVYNPGRGEMPQVLLIFRRGVWDLPKGKLEVGEEVEECAVREVMEEVGISVRPDITDALTDTYHEYEQDGIRYGKTTHWFSMRLPFVPQTAFEPEIEEGIKKVKWVELDEAKEVVGYDNLVDVLSSFEESHDSKLS